MAHGGVVAHSSSWTPAAYELEESSPPLDSHIGGLSLRHTESRFDLLHSQTVTGGKRKIVLMGFGESGIL